MLFFADRREAGLGLADKLQAYAGQNPLILAVPRGGVAVALPLWRRLGGELEVHITRKIGAPLQPELALGALSADGYLLVNERLTARLAVPRAYLEQAAQEEHREIERRMALYRKNRSAPVIEGRRVLLVDDGVATGFTVLAALRGLRKKKPRCLVLAVPVGPPDTLKMLSGEVDELYYLAAPPYFTAVGQFYRDFTQITDDEVLALLAEAVPDGSGSQGG